MIHVMHFMAYFSVLCAVARVDAVPATCPATASTLKSVPQCGHHAVLHCCSLLGVPASMDSVMERMLPKATGHSMVELISVLAQFGIKAEGRRENYDALRAGNFPVIAHMKVGHFVVIEKVDDDFVAILDGEGRRKLEMTKNYMADWDGKLLRLTRSNSVHALYPCLKHDDAARIQFDTLFVDIGEVPYERNTVDYDFGFRNLGKVDLIVDSVRTSCSCLKSVKPDRPISPGQVGKIKLTYAPNKGGAFIQKAYVQTNDPCTPIIELRAAGNTERRLLIDPPALDFGKVVLGQSKSISCMIRYLGDTPLVIQDVKCDAANVRVWQNVMTEDILKKLQDDRISVDAGFKSSVILSLGWRAMGNPGTVFSGKVELATNIKQFEHTSIQVRGEVASPVVATPAVVFFGEIDRESDVRQALTLRGLNGQRFRIARVNLEDTGLTCSYNSFSTEDKAELCFSGKGADALSFSNRTVSVKIVMAPGEEFELALPVYARQRAHASQ